VNLTDPSAGEAARAFPDPPADYGPVVWWGWNGPVTEDVIRRDLDALRAIGARGVLIEAGYGMAHRYLSPGWFHAVAAAVEEAGRRGMRVWIEDEGKYPSGFAGGRFSEERPDLRMRGLAVAERIPLRGGETADRALPPDTLGALAVEREDGRGIPLPVAGGRLRWTAPEGSWEVLAVASGFMTSVTRSVDDPTRGKTAARSLCDYMDPEAVDAFLSWVHEGYREALGEEMGRTFRGFMSDEPDYAHVPWTPSLPAEFLKRKGYDVLPRIAVLFAPRPTEEQRRVRADYWDVWSLMLRDGFFSRIGAWCADHGVEYIAHLNHENEMPKLVRSEGDFFRLMKGVHVPGVDAIWDQIWPGKTSDYPKLASSAAHLDGRPRAFSESFAAYRPIPDVDQARWVLDHQMARGINLFLLMFWPSSADPSEQPYPFFHDSRFPRLASYLSRASYLLSQGRPAAKIALYHPTTSLWLGDEESDRSVLAVAHGLLERQRDFDFVDDGAIGSAMELESGRFTNRSGQTYRAVLIPSVTALSRAAVGRLRSFAASGGTVAFLGRLPSIINGGNFLDAPAPEPGSFHWALREPTGELTPSILDALPRPDVVPDRPCPALRALHRKWRDADLYFLFNEGEEPLSSRVELEGSGRAQRWDAYTGGIAEMPSAAAAEGRRTVELELAPHGTEFVVIGASGA